MSAISSIPGNSDTALTAQIEKTAEPLTEVDKQKTTVEMQENTQADTVDSENKSIQKPSSLDNTQSYEDTLAVAEKLQSRIDEFAFVAHTVSIRRDEETKRYIIEIKDPDGVVVKVFPPEKVLNLHQKLDDLSGMVIDEMI